MEQANRRTLAWLAKGKVKADGSRPGSSQAGDYVAQVVPDRGGATWPGSPRTTRASTASCWATGTCSKDGMEWGVSGNPQKDEHLAFARAYLAERGIHFWETSRGENYGQVRWASGRGVVRDGTTGRIVGAGAPTMPFGHEDLYDEAGKQANRRRFAHLPQAAHAGHDPRAAGDGRRRLARQGDLLHQHVEAARRRPALPAAAHGRADGRPVPRAREWPHGHALGRLHGRRSTARPKAYDLRIPAVPEIAGLVGCKPIAKRNWLEIEGKLFSRVTDGRARSTPKPFVFDLKVETDESYMTEAGPRPQRRQEEGRGLLLPRDLAPRHRGVPGAAQEHRRRPPPHARHEHGELDPGPLHEARDGRRRVDALLALRLPGPARQVRQGLRGGLHALRGEGRARRDQALPQDPGPHPVAQDALDALRDGASVDHLQGPVQPALAAAARGRGALLQPVHGDHAQHQRDRDRGVQPRQREPRRAPEGRRPGRQDARPREAAAGRSRPRCACSTT